AEHLIGTGILVRLVDQHTPDAARRNGDRKLGVNGVRLALNLVRELKRLAGARIVDLDVRAFASAACRVDELRGAGARLFRQKANAELIGPRLEQRVLGVCVLREETSEPCAWLERTVGILTTGKRAVRAALRQRE